MLPALIICVGYCYVSWGFWCAALVIFQTIPNSYGVTGHVCILCEKYALTHDEVNKCKLQFHT